MKQAYQLDQKDWKEIKEYVQETREKWNKIRDIRNKIFAHEEELVEEKKLQILKKGEHDTLQDIISRLLIIENVLKQLGLNGKKPDFSFKPIRSKNLAETEVKKMLDLLSNQKKKVAS